VGIVERLEPEVGPVVAGVDQREAAGVGKPEEPSAKVRTLESSTSTAPRRSDSMSTV
jgi:hypothetical protein